MTIADEAMRDLEAAGVVAGSSPDATKKSQATELVDFATKRYSFHVTGAGEPFAIPLAGPYVARMLRGGQQSLRAEVANLYSQTKGRAPSSQACADALLVLEGRARQGTTIEPELRVARDAESVVIDLGDAPGRAVVIEGGSWTVMHRSPVLFRRTGLTGVLPEPLPGGDLVAEISSMINVRPDHGALLAAWLVATLIPEIGHPIVSLTGEQGTGKTSAGYVLSRLVDPAGSQVRKAPRDAESWVTQAAGSWVVALDNLSSISPWLSDSLCRAVTGEGDVRRRLYSDSDLSVFSFKRCLILTGIDLGALRGDLGRRLILVELEEIASFIGDDEFAARFEEAHPRLLGSLLDVAAKVLEALPTTKPVTATSMASFAKVLRAFDRVTGRHTLETYLGVADAVAEEVVEGDLVASAVRIFVQDRSEWTGTAGKLLEDLSPQLPDRPPKGWPTSARAMAAALKKVAPALRSVGVAIDYDHHVRPRRWVLRDATSRDGPETDDIDDAMTEHAPDQGKEACHSSGHSRHHVNVEDIDVNVGVVENMPLTREKCHPVINVNQKRAISNSGDSVALPALGPCESDGCTETARFSTYWGKRHCRDHFFALARELGESQEWPTKEGAS